MKISELSVVPRAKAMQPIALAIPQPDGSYRLLDAVTYRWIPVRVVVECPEGEVYFAPEEEVRRWRREEKVAKIQARRARKKSACDDAKEPTPARRTNFAAELFGALDRDVATRIRESMNG